MNPKRVPLSKLLEIDGALSAAINDIGDGWITNERKYELRRQLYDARSILRVYFDVPVEIEVKDDSEVAA